MKSKKKQKKNRDSRQGRQETPRRDQRKGVEYEAKEAFGEKIKDKDPQENQREDQREGQRGGRRWGGQGEFRKKEKLKCEISTPHLYLNSYLDS